MMQSSVFILAQDVMLIVGGTKTTSVKKAIGEENDALNVILGII